MAGTSETLLEARIISTAFGCLSSRSAGGDRSGTNRSSRPGPRVFVMGSTAVAGQEGSGQLGTWRQGRWRGRVRISIQGSMQVAGAINFRKSSPRAAWKHGVVGEGGWEAGRDRPKTYKLMTSAVSLHILIW